MAGADNLVRLDRLPTLEVRVRLPGVAPRPLCASRHQVTPAHPLAWASPRRLANPLAASIPAF